MSGDLTVLPRASIVRHQPELMRKEQAKADAIIEYAKKVKDWPLLEQAIALKIQQQAEFVVWWATNVTVRLNAGTKLSADLYSTLSRADAEKLTGISHVQVSRWRWADCVRVARL